VIDWEDLAERHVAEIQRGLPESIRAPRNRGSSVF